MARAVSLALALSFGLSASAATQETTFDFGGRLSHQSVYSSYPEDSLFRDLTDPNSLDHDSEARLNLGFDRGPWDLDLSSQLLVLSGNTIELTRELPPEIQPLIGRYPQDDARLMNLTHVFRDQGRSAALLRLDRLSAGYTSEKAVVRIGRQALTWGNGMVYTPMDILNPFDPAAVDKEYKIGDDMLYGQYLRDNGDDLQAVVVLRRDLETAEPGAEWSSFALKYHGSCGANEYDLLAARHFGDTLVAGGGSRSLGGAVWRGDLVLAFTDPDPTLTAVTSLSYSWVWWGKNVSGVAEYLFNGFGQPDGRYAPDRLAENPDLVSRLGRGELFTLGRHYVVASALVELHPLFQITPNVFVNLSDGSALVQLVTQNDLKQDLVLRGALGLPLGARGTEFGGFETDVPERYLSTGPSLLLQLSWYF